MSMWYDYELQRRQILPKLKYLTRITTINVKAAILKTYIMPVPKSVSLFRLLCPPKLPVLSLLKRNLPVFFLLPSLAPTFYLFLFTDLSWHLSTSSLSAVALPAPHWPHSCSSPRFLPLKNHALPSSSEPTPYACKAKTSMFAVRG